MKTDVISAAVAYRMALEKIAAAPSLAAAVREARRMLVYTFDRPEEGTVTITSGYGHNTKQPFVTFSMANPSESANPTIQMTSAQARKQAQYILEAADAAETDGFLVEWMRGDGGLNEQQMGAMLASFRAFRDQLRNDGSEE